MCISTYYFCNLPKEIKTTGKFAWIETHCKFKNLTAFLHKKLKQRTSGRKSIKTTSFFLSSHQQVCLPARVDPFAQGIARSTCEPAEPEEESAVSGLSRCAQSWPDSQTYTAPSGHFRN